MDEIVCFPELMREDKEKRTVRFDKPLSQWLISTLGPVNDKDEMMTSNVKIILLKSCEDIGYIVTETDKEITLEYGYREEDGSFKSLDDDEEEKHVL